LARVTVSATFSFGEPEPLVRQHAADDKQVLPSWGKALGRDLFAGLAEITEFFVACHRLRLTEAT
jgi:hypothetical protein